MRSKGKRYKIAEIANVSVHERNARKGVNYFLALFLTSSSLQACSINLLGCPGVIPEWPFDQS